MRNIIFELQEVLFIFRIISCFFKICSGTLFYTFIRIPFCNCQKMTNIPVNSSLLINSRLHFCNRKALYLRHISNIHLRVQSWLFRATFSLFSSLQLFPFILKLPPRLVCSHSSYLTQLV